ncbi:MAG: hypothetical protein ACFE0I_16390 [Elainellaceae cyanobacterium]
MNQVISSGKISRDSYLTLATALLSNARMTSEERRQINQIFDYAQTGRLKIVD